MRCPYCKADVKQDQDHRPWWLWCTCGAFAVGERLRKSPPQWDKPPKFRPQPPPPQYKMVSLACPQCDRPDEGIEGEGRVNFGCPACGWSGEFFVGAELTLCGTVGAADRFRPSAFEEMENMR